MSILMMMFLYSCGFSAKDDIVSVELISSEGEKICILTTNWGVTGDHQLSAVTKDKNKFQDKRDTVGSIAGLNPFEYRFENDTLTLYFRNEINYKIDEKFNSITVQYKIMKSDYYEHRDTSFHSVPEIEYATAPDMPQPPSRE